MKLESRNGTKAGALITSFWSRGYLPALTHGDHTVASLARKLAENRNPSRVSTISGAGASNRVRRASTKGSQFVNLNLGVVIEGRGRLYVRPSRGKTESAAAF